MSNSAARKCRSKKYEFKIILDGKGGGDGNFTFHDQPNAQLNGHQWNWLGNAWIEFWENGTRLERWRCAYDDAMPLPRGTEDEQGSLVYSYGVTYRFNRDNQDGITNRTYRAFDFSTYDGKTLFPSGVKLNPSATSTSNDTLSGARTNIQIHVGNEPGDSNGCVVVSRKFFLDDVFGYIDYWIDESGQTLASYVQSAGAQRIALLPVPITATVSYHQSAVREGQPILRLSTPEHASPNSPNTLHIALDNSNGGLTREVEMRVKIDGPDGSLPFTLSPLTGGTVQPATNNPATATRTYTVTLAQRTTSLDLKFVTTAPVGSDFAVSIDSYRLGRYRDTGEPNDSTGGSRTVYEPPSHPLLRFSDQTSSHMTVRATTTARNGDGGNDVDLVQPRELTASLGTSRIDNVRYAGSGQVLLPDNIENLRLVGALAASGVGNNLNNTLVGNDAANSLYAKGGNDVVDGGGGDDLLIAGSGAGDDRYDGGPGTDRISFASTHRGVTVNLASGRANGVEVGTDTLNGIENVGGGSGPDRITGNADDNVLDGGAGADTLAARAGDDTYLVDHLGDTVTENAGEGSDTVRSSVSFTLGAHLENLALTGSAASNGSGNAQANVLTGNSGNNVLNGGAGADTMIGGAGNDTYLVDNLGDTVTENAGKGSDTVRSSVSFTLGAHLENLTLTGPAASNGTGNVLANLLTGNSGNNVLDGAAGADTMSGGAGDDTYLVDHAGDRVSESLNAGADLVRSTLSYTLGTHLENLELFGAAALNGSGNEQANRLTGNDRDNLLDGRGGNDNLLGGLGNDTLNGGGGIDTLAGGAGDDLYLVDHRRDAVIENAGEGNDTLRISYANTRPTPELIDLSRFAEVENLEIVGTGRFNLVGTSANNRLAGNSGANTMSGGAGDDRYVVDNAGDTVAENAGEGSDTVQSSVSFTLGANLENLSLLGSAAINGAGNDLANRLSGNAAANRLSGGVGDDVLGGGRGNDTLTGGAGADTFRFDSPLNALTNRDTITDFNPADDRIALENDVFSGLAPGPFADWWFRSGAGATSAADADDRLIYDTSSGALYFDADGLGGRAAVPFATLAADGAGHRPVLSAIDFLVT